jgi:hypothetical protein
MDLCRGLRPRRDRAPLAVAGRRHGPRADKAEGSPRVGISRLHSTASALAVYASPSPLRCRRRKTRFRWLARPCRVGLVTHRVATKGFKVTTTSPPFLSFPGAMSGTFLLVRAKVSGTFLLPKVFFLGTSAQDAGSQPTNFARADSTVATHAVLDGITTRGRVIA